jgi:hypothetical protein
VGGGLCLLGGVKATTHNTPHSQVVLVLDHLQSESD